MKKTYKNPALTVVKMQPAHIMAGSFKRQLGSQGVNGSASLGRESRFSDDDWEEEQEV